MSFWIVQEWFVTIGTLDPYKDYFGNHRGFDTRDEALAFQQEFNASPERAEDLDVCGRGPPCRNYKL